MKNLPNAAKFLGARLRDECSAADSPINCRGHMASGSLAEAFPSRRPAQNNFGTGPEYSIDRMRGRPRASVAEFGGTLNDVLKPVAHKPASWRSSRSVIGASYGIVKIINTRAGRVASARCSIRGDTRITHSHPPRTQPKCGARCAAIAVRSGGRPEDGRAASAMSSPAATRMTSPVVVCRRATMMRWRRRWQRRGRQQHAFSPPPQEQAADEALAREMQLAEWGGSLGEVGRAAVGRTAAARSASRGGGGASPR